MTPDPSDAEREVLAMLLPRFVQHRTEDVQRLRDALDRGDFVAVATIGHNLRGNGASYGFPELSALGARMETAAIAKDRDRVAREIDGLETQVAALPDAVPRTP